MKNAFFTALLILAAISLFAGERDPATCPMHEAHMKAAKAKAAQTSDSVVPIGDAQHGVAVDSRHDSLVASHDTTRHSFRLFADGGAIELRATDRSDKETIDGVRTHLQEIAAEFAKSDFSTPAFVHGREPAGVAGMQKLHDSIEFAYETRDGGGRIRMKTANPEALASIHDFLKFQVVEHRTDNTGRIERDK